MLLMARAELKDRQFTIYAPSKDALKRWKQLCKPMTLNSWILELIERGIEEIESAQPQTKSSDAINDLRKENRELRKEVARLQREVAAIPERSEEPLLDKGIVLLLKAGGVWSSTQIIKELNKEVPRVDMPNFSNKIPDISSFTNKIHRAESINRTLEQLEYLDLITNTIKGWKWIK
jgi:hypothetical protein